MLDRLLPAPAREATVSEWLPLPPEIDGLTGAGQLLLLATLLHFLLRLLDRFGIIHYSGTKFRRGLGTAAVALNAIFQPHARAPDNNCDRVARKQTEVGDGDDGRAPAPAALDVRNLPDDGLRGHGWGLPTCDGLKNGGNLVDPKAPRHGPPPDKNRGDPQPHK